MTQKNARGSPRSPPQNDLAIERIYRSKPFTSDEERLEYLFALYEKMIEEEKNKDTMFETIPKKKKKGKLG
jgi:hypothetical protein